MRCTLRLPLWSLAPLVAAQLAVSTVSPAQSSPPPSAIAFVGANVVPMDRERVVNDQTVIVMGDRIHRIGPTASTPVPPGAHIIDARGKFLMPGLAEMHAHLPGAENAVFRDRVLMMFLTAGVTTVRSLAGAPSHIGLRKAAGDGEIVSPRIIAAAPGFAFSNTPPEMVRSRITAHREAGFDAIKCCFGLIGATPQQMSVTFDSLGVVTRELGIPLVGHTPLGLERALRAGYSTVEHLDGYFEWMQDPTDNSLPRFYFGYLLTDSVDTGRIADVVNRTRDAGAWVVPTQSLQETVISREEPVAFTRQPGMEYIPKSMVDEWIQSLNQTRPRDMSRVERYHEIRRQLIRALHRGGVGVLLGSDAPQTMNVPGFSIHKELASFVRAGLTPFEALQTGTTNVARYLGNSAEAGTVEAGKRADIVLLDANPLADIDNVAKVHGVMVLGRWYDASDLHRRLAAATK